MLLIKFVASSDYVQYKIVFVISLIFWISFSCFVFHLLWYGPTYHVELLLRLSIFGIYLYCNLVTKNESMRNLRVSQLWIEWKTLKFSLSEIKHVRRQGRIATEARMGINNWCFHSLNFFLIHWCLSPQKLLGRMIWFCSIF